MNSLLGLNSNMRAADSLGAFSDVEMACGVSLTQLVDDLAICVLAVEKAGELQPLFAVAKKHLLGGRGALSHVFESGDAKFSAFAGWATLDTASRCYLVKLGDGFKPFAIGFCHIV